MIEFCNATLGYGKVEVLSKLNGEFGAAGKKIALLGENGAGKSTLLKTLSGLLLPLAGSVEVAGIEVKKSNLSELRRMIGVIFQNPDDQLFAPTVALDVSFGPRNLRVSALEVKRRTEEALEQLGLSGLEEYYPHNLSFGQKRRVAIAGVLAMNPALLLFDEPTSGLDPRGRREFMEILHKLPQFCLVATHDLEFARHSCTEAIVLSNGSICYHGRINEILNDPRLLFSCGLS